MTSILCLIITAAGVLALLSAAVVIVTVFVLSRMVDRAVSIEPDPLRSDPSSDLEAVVIPGSVREVPLDDMPDHVISWRADAARRRRQRDF